MMMSISNCMYWYQFPKIFSYGMLQLFQIVSVAIFTELSHSHEIHKLISNLYQYFSLLDNILGYFNVEYHLWISILLSTTVLVLLQTWCYSQYITKESCFNWSSEANCSWSSCEKGPWRPTSKHSNNTCRVGGNALCNILLLK